MFTNKTSGVLGAPCSKNAEGLPGHWIDEGECSELRFLSRLHPRDPEGYPYFEKLPSGFTEKRQLSKGA